MDKWEKILDNDIKKLNEHKKRNVILIIITAFLIMLVGLILARFFAFPFLGPIVVKM